MTEGTPVKRVLKSETSEGYIHAYTEEEKEAIVDHINMVLQDDPQLESYLPLNPNNDDIFVYIQDGVLLWFVFN
jgi:hypothetical protein